MNKLTKLTLALFITGLAITSAWGAPSCLSVARQVGQQLHGNLDSGELALTLTSLNKTGQLPDKFVDKRTAKSAGWRPGLDLWTIPSLRGKSMGGDRFGNYERQLPQDKWREADLGYRGGKRNAKRLIYAESGRRFITVDHYIHFIEIPTCQ